MSLAANKALAQRWFEEVWNQGKESTIDELFHHKAKPTASPSPTPSSSARKPSRPYTASSTVPSETFTSTSTTSSLREIASPSVGPSP